MFKFIKSLFARGKKPAQDEHMTLEYIVNYLAPWPQKSIRYFRSLGSSGRAVSVFVDQGRDDMIIKFERKIEHSDVVGGALLPIAMHTTKQRGGKRSVSLAVTYESAEALHAALGCALRETRRRRTFANIVHRTWEMMYVAHEKASQ